MKKLLLFSLAAASLTMTSCSNTTSKTEEKNTDTPSVEQTEPKQQKAKSIEIGKAEFTSKIADTEDLNNWKYLGDKPAIVDFYASWCGPCKMIAPILDELANEYGNEIYIYKVDVDKEGQLANAFGIQSIPHLLFIPMEGKPHIINGALPKEDFKNMIDSVLLQK